MSTVKKYICSLCSNGTTKSNFETCGCCAKCKDKIEKSKKTGSICANCKQSDSEMFIKLNGLCVKCNNKRCGLYEQTKNEIEETKKEEEGTPGSESDSDTKTNNKKEIVDHLISVIVQTYAEMGLDKNITRNGFILTLKTSLNEFLENELNN